MNLPQHTHRGRTILQSHTLTRTWTDTTPSFFLLPQVILNGAAQPFIGPFHALGDVQLFIDDPARFRRLVGGTSYEGAAYDALAASALPGAGGTPPSQGGLRLSARSNGAVR